LGRKGIGRASPATSDRALGRIIDRLEQLCVADRIDILMEIEGVSRVTASVVAALRVG
jgi:hypothetical protein